MIPIDNIPKDLHDALNKFSDWFFEQDRSHMKIRGSGADAEYHCSLEYLKKRQQEGHSGYPDALRGIDMQTLKGFDLDTFYPMMQKVDVTIKNYICARNCAIKMYYPEDGYIDWHTNENAYGYNALFTYSRTGDGAFVFQNPSTKEIITIPDKKGWNMKVGLYDKHDGAPLWHAAWTRCERLTWGYIIDEMGWENLVEELQIDTSPLQEMYGGMPSFRKLPV